jgi:hypothetical protein
MAFSDAFARSYAVGSDMRKRRATSKFFEKFKELTADVPEDAGLPEELPGFNPEGSGEKAPTALPVQDAGEDGLAPVVGAEAAAIPVDVKGPKAIPIATKDMKDTAEKLANSLTKDNIKELDRLALDAAKASGDMEVYKALKDTTVSFLQGKTLSNLSQAQAAMEEGDVDGAEKALKKAYRFVPDGREANFKKKDGKLYAANPWAGQEGEPDEVELTATRIGQFGVMLSDPKKYTELMMGEEDKRAARKDKAADRALREREVKSLEDSRSEAARHNGIMEGLQQQDIDIKAKRAKAQNLVDVAQAAKLMGEASTKGGDGMKPDDARQLSVAAGTHVAGFLMPTMDMTTTDQITGETKIVKQRAPAPEGYDMFVDKNGNLNAAGLTAQELAGNIAVYNPTLGVPMTAGVGMELARSLLAMPGDSPEIKVDRKNNRITVPLEGRNVTVDVAPALISSLVGVYEQQQQGE